MRGEVPLLFCEKILGTVSFFEDAGMICFIAQCRWGSDEIARAYMGELLIGVLEPQGDGVFRSRKRYSKTELKEKNVCIESIEYGTIRTKDDISNLSWQACKNPAKIFDDYAMKHALRGHGDVLIDHEYQPKYVAAPMTSQARFALAPAFTQVEVHEISGKKYGVVAVDKKRLPTRFTR